MNLKCLSLWNIKVTEGSLYCGFLGFDTMKSCKWLPVFQMKTVVSSSEMLVITCKTIRDNQKIAVDIFTAVRS